MMTTGTLYGIGVGPGDPELLTLKAVRIIRAAPVVAYPTNLEGQSQARDIAAPLLTSDQREVPIPMPFQTNREPADRAYDQAAITLGEVLAGGQDVAVLCEGDPLFFGSFIYIQQRLVARFPCIVIPGITSVGGATAVAAMPLAAGNDCVAIVPATSGDANLRHALKSYDSIVIMKPGRRRPRILQLLRETDRFDDAVYVEQATREDQQVITRPQDIDATAGPYFALFLINRGDKR